MIGPKGPHSKLGSRGRWCGWLRASWPTSLGLLMMLNHLWKLLPASTTVPAGSSRVPRVQPKYQKELVCLAWFRCLRGLLQDLGPTSMDQDFSLLLLPPTNSQVIPDICAAWTPILTACSRLEKLLPIVCGSRLCLPESKFDIWEQPVNTEHTSRFPQAAAFIDSIQRCIPAG